MQRLPSNTSDGNIRVGRKLLTPTQVLLFRPVQHPIIQSMNLLLLWQYPNIHPPLFSQDPALEPIPGPNQLNSYLPVVTYSNPFNIVGFIQIFETELFSFLFLLQV